MKETDRGSPGVLHRPATRAFARAAAVLAFAGMLAASAASADVEPSIVSPAIAEALPCVDQTALPAVEATAPTSIEGRRVVLLHGLIRTWRSMSKIEDALREVGYRVCNVGYPSRHHSIEVLASDHVAPAVARCFPGETAPIDFVTHSMGGIIVRQMAATRAVPSIGRVVMLGPPNAGSEIVDEFASWWLFRAINGPAGGELGTSAASVPCRLGPATFELGIIAGGKSRNWLLSRFLPGQNDGKVSVASARLDGMKDFVLVDANHTFMVRDDAAIAQTIRFLEDGAFERQTRTASASPAAVVAPAAARAAATAVAATAAATTVVQPPAPVF